MITKLLKKIPTALIMLPVLLMLVLLTLQNTTHAATITVTTAVDEYAPVVGDQGCSLREAVQAATDNNIFGGCDAGDDLTDIGSGVMGDLIVFDNSLDGIPQTLTETGVIEDLNIAGDLDIRDINLKILGNGESSTIIDGAGNDRVLDISVAAANSVYLENLTIQNGYLEGAPGAGILKQDNGNLYITNARITSNETDDLGGGFYIMSGMASINNSLIDNNTAYQAAGILNDSSVWSYMNNSTVENNTSSYACGGVENRGEFYIENTTISGNVATSQYGGGICNESGVVGITNSTISNNTSNSGGSAILNIGGIDSQLTINFTTITGNLQQGADEGIYNQYDAGSMDNFSVAANEPGVAMISSSIIDDSCNDPLTQITSWGYNIETGNTCNLLDATDLTNTDPLLDSNLQDNGGPTKTHALLMNSPAIDHMTNMGDGGPMTDQRGELRPKNLVPDSGSYEFESITDLEMIVFANGFTTYYTTIYKIDYIINNEVLSQEDIDKLTALKELINELMLDSSNSEMLDAEIASVFAEVNPPEPDPVVFNEALNNDFYAGNLAISSADAGDDYLFYYLVVKNAGPGTAKNVKITNTLPDGLEFIQIVTDDPSCGELDGTITCFYSELFFIDPFDGSPAEPARVIILTKVSDSIINGTEITNEGSVSTDTIDTNPANNTNSTTLTVNSDILPPEDPPTDGEGGSSDDGGGGGPLPIKSNNDNSGNTQEEVETAVEEGTAVGGDLLDDTVCSFEDIVGHYAQDAIESLCFLDIVSGYEDGIHFGPDDDLTRSQATKIILNAFDIEVPESVSENPFPDVLASKWYATFIAKGLELEYVEGYGNGLFKPDAPVSRSEFLSIIERVLDLLAQDATFDVNPFPDVEENQWYTNTVLNAFEYGLITGYDNGNFGPHDNITRGDASIITNNTLQSHSVPE
jgi:CSLREA domain-containing protein/uncharacterized repeat protein (TIGR01451 family)